MTKRILLAAVAALVAGCAHRPLSPQARAQVKVPAFVSRVTDGAGPRARVFREDPIYARALKNASPSQGDERLQQALQTVVTRFEVSERIRAATQSKLPDQAPWNAAPEPAKVASVLQIFLVKEVPARPPEYQTLATLGADSVVEVVVEEYGLRSASGRASAYLKGHGRMFLLDGTELWHRAFDVDGLRLGRPPLNVSQVAAEPRRFHDELLWLIEGIADTFAKDLTR